MNDKRIEEMQVQIEPLQKELNIDDYIIKGLKEPIAYLHHRNTNVNIAVYEKMPWFNRVMCRVFFGLEYHKID